jgi:antitoxin component YwqK of YwqJK toxin-antitoxin module
MMRTIIYIFVLLLTACNSNTNIPRGDFSDMPEAAELQGYPMNEDLKQATVYGGGNYVMEQGDYYNGLRHGTWTTYYPATGYINTLTNYFQGKRQGICLKMDNSGRLTERLFFHDDLMHGVYTKYEDGAAVETRNYKLGKLEGLLVKYYPNGNRMEESPYENGKINGVAKWYDQDGNLTIEYTYEAGVLLKQ